ncbi:MAG: hypothetical protein EO766_12405 [Hydrotalea sp. AMD]|uniref:hypothetical protein n=1 Tax=Hydrotalea sp. AMD TaxID=2501297 RepID=UPI0010282B99|nr:hypothetical protein [Hydrotalea sp. AMD]RWZ87320.1 MAG: hypothetical protein EO766_12405 [Hydrotalea sp. AMD]
MAYDDDFNNVLDSIFTSSNYTDDINGLLDDEDLPLVKGKSSNIQDNDDSDIIIVSNQFDPSEFADDGSSYGSDDEEDMTVSISTINKQNKTISSPFPNPTGYKNKMEHARAIYARERAKGFTKRAHFIALFQSEAGCTPAGASTYYATIKNS